MIDIDIIFSNYLKNSRLKKAITGSQKISNTELEDYLTKFIKKLKTEGKFMKTDDDFKTHFARWLKIQLKNLNKNKFHGSNSAYD